MSRSQKYLVVLCALFAVVISMWRVPVTYAETTPATETSGSVPATSTPTVALTVKPVVKVSRPLRVGIVMKAVETSAVPEATLETQKFNVVRGKWSKSSYKAVSLPKTSPEVKANAAVTFSAHGPRRVRLRYRWTPTGKYSVTPWASVTVCGPKVIALTLDDGPDKRDTPIALKALRRYQARATFFMMGNRVAKSPGLVRQMSTAGHQLGNHTWRHVPATSLTSREFEDSVVKTNKAITRALSTSPSIAATHRYPIVFRYPWGSGNQRTMRVLAKLGVSAYGWDYATGDGGSHGPKSKYVTDLIARKVITNAKPNQIVLMHDGQDRPNSVAALPRILRVLSERGYDFVTVADLRMLTGK